MTSFRLRVSLLIEQAGTLLKEISLEAGSIRSAAEEEPRHFADFAFDQICPSKLSLKSVEWT